MLKNSTALSAALLMTTALTASAAGLSAPTIGETTALIPEAGLATTKLKDGESANTNFPFANFKALATVGEVDKTTGKALTGYPDGQAAWLAKQGFLVSSIDQSDGPTCRRHSHLPELVARQCQQGMAQPRGARRP